MVRMCTDVNVLSLRFASFCEASEPSSEWRSRQESAEWMISELNGSDLGLGKMLGRRNADWVLVCMRRGKPRRRGSEAQSQVWLGVPAKGLSFLVPCILQYLEQQLGTCFRCPVHTPCLDSI